MNLHDLPEYHLPQELHEQRQQMHIAKGALLEESVRNWDFDDRSFNAVRDRPMAMHETPMADMYSHMAFGAANTVELAGCVCFVSYYILKDFNYKYDFNFSFEEWVNEVVQKGYRAWKFKNYPGTFTTPAINLEEVKTRFKGKVDLTCCDTKEKLIEKLGEPIGIGGSMYLIDNVIAYLNQEEFGEKGKPVEDTRLTSVESILVNLASELYVPMRVNNAIYHKDPERVGGHYVTLYGIENGIAYVWDSSIGSFMLPFKDLMEAAIKDKDLIAVWDLG